MKIDDVRLKVLVDDPIARVLASIGSPSIEVRRGADALREELVAALGGRIVAFARVHGDLCAENVLLDEDAMNVAGIVDWECSRGQGLAVIDRMWFAMTLAAKASRCSIGELLVRTLRSDRPSDLFVGWLRCALPNESTDSIDARTACLLAWLNHVDSNLAKSTRYRGSKWWIAQNVTCVLRELVTTER